MSRRWIGGRIAVVIGILMLFGFAFTLPTASLAAVPVPQATTASPGASESPKASASPSPTQSDPDAEPPDEPADDGTAPTPAQSGTWLASGGAAALSLLAGLVVALRKR